MGQELVIQGSQAIQQTWFDASLIAAQIGEVQKIYKSIMKHGVHYGPAFPGSDKPSLLQPGAELLNLVFRVAMKPEIQISQLERGHREYTITMTATNAENGQFLGSGVGSCSTMESKYRYRNASLKCPECGAETIFKSKNGDGWYCWAKKGGCGAKFNGNDERVASQKLGKVENPDIADLYNTVLKIAKKRAMVDCCKAVTGASAFFSQDAEDFIDADFSDITEGGNGHSDGNGNGHKTNGTHIVAERQRPASSGNGGEHENGLSSSDKIQLKKAMEQAGRLQEFLANQGNPAVLQGFWNELNGVQEEPELTGAELSDAEPVPQPGNDGEQPLIEQYGYELHQIEQQGTPEQYNEAKSALEAGDTGKFFAIHGNL